MPRNYKREPGSRKYQDYTDAHLDAAVREYQAGTLSLRKLQEKYGIPFNTIKTKADGKHSMPAGGQTVFSTEQENSLIKLIKVCGDWGCPLSTLDIRMIAQRMLAAEGRTVKRFKNNVPGFEWVMSFLKRHKNDLSIRQAQNIKAVRAAKGSDEINSYFDNLQNSLENVPASNIINYDETNLSDDPGRAKVVFKRGTKYPERILNTTKSCTSIMFAGTPTGVILAPYVVFKAEHMWDTWCSGGPVHARYNRSKSGWFDSCCFHDWFTSVIIPYCRKLQGPKVLIGDNLSSHLNAEIISLCEVENIRFVFLPPNSTHLTQPLDVCFFRPLKMKWRQILTKWKMDNTRLTTLPKDSFAPLLKTLCNEIGLENNSSIESGFKETGIFPLDREKVLRKIPDSVERVLVAQQQANDAVLQHLKTLRSPGEQIRTRHKKVDVAPGKSVGTADFQGASTSGVTSQQPTKRPRKTTSKSTSIHDVTDVESDSTDEESDDSDDSVPYADSSDSYEKEVLESDDSGEIEGRNSSDADDVEDVPLATLKKPVPLAALKKPVPLAALKKPVPLAALKKPVPLAALKKPVPLAALKKPVPLATLKKKQCQDDASEDEDDQPLAMLQKQQIQGPNVNLGNVKVDDFVWVKFTENKFYAGKVIQAYGNWEFSVKFMRNRVGSTFVWPQNEDVADIEFPQIVRILHSHKDGRRGEIVFEADDLATGTI